MTWRIEAGDARAVLAGWPAGSVDSIVTDPPYPEIDRPYGRLTEAAWMDLMQAVTRQARRVLKPTGSALFIVQPNSAHVGTMRLWVWDFLSWAGREWNIVQDAYWWNYAALPTAGASQARGLMRPSVKYCIWLGAPDCYRNQDAGLWAESETNRIKRLAERQSDRLEYNPSGQHVRRSRISAKAAERGGVVPFNLLPIAAGDSQSSSGAHGHGAGTPAALAAWWQRYLTPPRGVTADPFMGGGTMALTALRLGLSVLGIEQDASYVAMARARIVADAPLFNRQEGAA